MDFGFNHGFVDPNHGNWIRHLQKRTQRYSDKALNHWGNPSAVTAHDLQVAANHVNTHWDNCPHPNLAQIAIKHIPHVREVLKDLGRI